MPRATIDFGIDLGTTNSEIALVQEGTACIIRNGLRDEATPSAVRIDSRGTIIVGRQAYNHRVDDPENTHIQFKRLMGTQQVLSFKSSGRRTKPEELSAEVLKSLLRDVGRETGEEVSAAVITVPAMFEIPQCDATRRAAELARITCSPLLQEPIAAALAYGFEAKSLDGFLLVYDFGGGTFDASIIRSQEGRLRVVDHAGDNYLGGKNLDEALVNAFLQILKQDFGLPLLDPESQRGAFAKLFFEAENARIQLSDTESCPVSLSGLGRGLEDFAADFEITRSQLETAIAPLVARTTEICEELLRSNRLSSKDLDKIILVGGPTLTPYVRAAVEGALGVAPEFRVDPITIVARGAALFAASQRTPEGAVTKAMGAAVPLKLIYSPVSQDTETDIAGKFESATGAAIARVEIRRSDGAWSSGQLAVSNSTFMSSVFLRERAVNEFEITAWNSSGGTILVDPSGFSITHGPMVEDAPLSRSILLGLQDNSVLPLIHRGTAVPCKAPSTPPGAIVTAHDVSRGEAKDVLNIPLYQGENRLADRNREIGRLQIHGTEIKRTLPQGSEVQIAVEVDRDFHVKLRAYIPLLEQAFDHICDSPVAPIPKVQEIEADLEEQKQRLAAVSPHPQMHDNPPGPAPETRAQRIAAELEAQLPHARANDPDAIERARRGIEDLKAAIDLLESAQEWPKLLQSFEEAKEFASEAVQTAPSPEKYTARMARILSEAESAVQSKDGAKLKKRVSDLEALGWEIYTQQDGFWTSAFQDVAKYANKFVDKRRGDSLMEEGTLALERGDFASLQSIVRELYALLPETEKTANERAKFASSLRKRTGGYL